MTPTAELKYPAVANQKWLMQPNLIINDLIVNEMI